MNKKLLIKTFLKHQETIRTIGVIIAVLLQTLVLLVNLMLLISTGV